MTPLLHDVLKRRVFLTGVWVLLAAAFCLVPLQAVVVKRLPFDNKSEFQIVIDMPEGTTLEGTAAVTMRIGDYLRSVPEVADLALYVGNAAPYNFNGLVRHYFLLRVPREERSSVADLGRIHVQSGDGRLVPISQLVRVEETAGERSLYRKNLQPVVYVTADVAGRTESPVHAILELGAKIDAIPFPEGYTIIQCTARQPFTTDHLAMKWDGEWHITYELFRDLGLAFAVVLVLIYILVVGWFQSLSTPRAIYGGNPVLAGRDPAGTLAARRLRRHAPRWRRAGPRRSARGSPAQRFPCGRVRHRATAVRTERTAVAPYGSGSLTLRTRRSVGGAGLHTQLLGHGAAAPAAAGAGSRALRPRGDDVRARRPGAGDRVRRRRADRGREPPPPRRASRRDRHAGSPARCRAGSARAGPRRR
jgi:hypothetical protein